MERRARAPAHHESIGAQAHRRTRRHRERGRVSADGRALCHGAGALGRRRPQRDDGPDRRVSQSQNVNRNRKCTSAIPPAASRSESLKMEAVAAYPRPKEVYESNKLAKRLRRLVGQAIADYDMIREGDKVMVCLSGGKDSYALLDVLLDLKQRAPIAFELGCGKPRPEAARISAAGASPIPGIPRRALPHREQDTYSVVKRVIPEGRTMCSLCSRLRRGVLYRVAGELGATRIALGHHRDDILQTFFLNLFYGGKLKTMPPKLLSDDGGTSSSARLRTARKSTSRPTRAAAVSDHSVHALRLAGKSPAQAHQGHAHGMGNASSRTRRDHFPKPSAREPFAPARQLGFSTSPDWRRTPHRLYRVKSGAVSASRARY